MGAITAKMERTKRANDLGSVGERLAATVKALREQARLSLTELAERATGLGRPIQASGLRRIEDAAEATESERDRKPRRVDVDDLVALALALNVSPVRLLLPRHADDWSVKLVGNVKVPATGAWSWALNEWPMPQVGVSEDEQQAGAEFYRRNSIPPERQPRPMREAAAESEAVRMLSDAVVAARREGISRATMAELVSIMWLPAGTAAADGNDGDG
jgi:transcriptional regulator with XRE-family HTH domain